MGKLAGIRVATGEQRAERGERREVRRAERDERRAERADERRARVGGERGSLCVRGVQRTRRSERLRVSCVTEMST